MGRTGEPRDRVLDDGVRNPSRKKPSIGSTPCRESAETVTQEGERDMAGMSSAGLLCASSDEGAEDGEDKSWSSLLSSASLSLELKST